MEKGGSLSLEGALVCFTEWFVGECDWNKSKRLIINPWKSEAFCTPLVHSMSLYLDFLSHQNEIHFVLIMYLMYGKYNKISQIWVHFIHSGVLIELFLI